MGLQQFVSSESGGTFQIAIVRVATIDSADPPQRLNGVEASAMKLTDDIAALRKQPGSERPVAYSPEGGQSGRREQEDSTIIGRLEAPAPSGRKAE